MGNKAIIEGAPARTFLDWAALFLATGFGSGYFPIAPGTPRTVVAVPIYLLLVSYLRVNLLLYIGIVIVITALGCVVAHRAGRHFGIIDAGQIVIDEIAGFLVSMIAAPPGWPAIVLGFLLFRLADILKPWP